MTGKRHARRGRSGRPQVSQLAEEARTRMLHQIDERRHPGTNATVDQLLDRHFELVTLQRSTLATDLG